MKNLIIGKIMHNHDDLIKMSETYSLLTDKIVKLEEELTKNFDEQQKKLFVCLQNFIIEIELESSEQHFAEGIKMGMLLGKEVFENCD